MIYYRSNNFAQSYQIHSVGMRETKVMRLGSNRFIIVNVNVDSVIDSWNKWQRGDLIQNAFPDFDADEREFLITGLTPSEFDAATKFVEE